jgi:hypothetical protein
VDSEWGGGGAGGSEVPERNFGCEMRSHV